MPLPKSCKETETMTSSVWLSLLHIREQETAYCVRSQLLFSWFLVLNEFVIELLFLKLFLKAIKCFSVLGFCEPSWAEGLDYSVLQAVMFTQNP